MKRKTPNSVFGLSFFRYLITYMIYLLVLLRIMIFYYWQNIRYWQEDRLLIYESVLTNKTEEFQKQLSHISALGGRLSQDSRYQALSRQELYEANADYVKMAVAQRDFTNIMLPYALVSECGIYYPKNHSMITRHRSFVGEQGMEKYYGMYFQVADYSRQEWVDLLSSDREAGLHVGMKVTSYDYGECDALIYNRPLDYGTLYAVIDIDTLAKFFIPEEIGQDGYFCVADSQGNNLLTSQYDEKAAASLFWEISRYDSYNQLWYKVGIPKAYLNVLMEPLLSGLIVYVVLVLLGGIALAMFFSYRNNYPMHNLVISASFYDRKFLPDNQMLNEHDYIAGVMNRLHTSLESMERKLDRQRMEERRHYLEKAVQGGLNSSDMMTRFRELFPEFPEEYRIVIVILMEDGSITENMRLSRNLLMQQALNDFYSGEITFTSTCQDTILFVLSNREEEKLKTQGKNSCRELQLFLEKQLNQKTQIAMSSPLTDILEMPSAYMATLYQFRARIETQDADVPAEERFEQNAFVCFDFMYYQQFFEALSNGEETIAVSLIRKIENIITSATGGFEKRQVGETVCRFLYTDNLSSLCNILLQVKLNYFDILSGVSIPAAQSFRDVESFFDELAICCHRICAKLEENKKRIKRQQLHRQVMEFLNGHINDSSLSARMAADYFHISDNTLQKIVKNAAGKTFYEYVEDCRISRALHLLRSTQEPVESIALQCGFSSYNSMYKVFKRRYNLSPKAAAETVE